MMPRIREIVCVCESRTITNGVQDATTGCAGLPVRSRTFQHRGDLVGGSAAVSGPGSPLWACGGDPPARPGRRLPRLAGPADGAGGGIPEPCRCDCVEDL